jgi:hypothetical protein
LVTQARELARRGARAEAEILAAHGLRLGASIDARGVLMATRASTRPTRNVWHLPEPCDAGTVASRGASWVCIGPRGTTMYDWPASGPRIRWRSGQTGQAVHLGSGRVGVGDPIGITWLDEQNGHVLGHTPTQSGLSAWVPFGADLIGSTSVALLTWQASSSQILEEHPCASHHGLAGYSTGQTLEVLCADGALRARQDGAWVDVGSSGLYGDQTGSLLRFGSRRLVGSLRGRVGEIGEGAYLESDLGQITALRPEPAGTRALVVGTRGVDVWSFEAGALSGRFPGGGWRDAGWVGAGSVLLLASDRAERWHLSPLDPPRTLMTPAGLADVALSADGAWMALARGDGVVEVREMASGRRVLRDGDDKGALSSPVCKRVAFAPEIDRLVATCGGDSRVREYGLPGWKRSVGRLPSLVPRLGVLPGRVDWATTYGTAGPTYVGPAGVFGQWAEVGPVVDAGNAADGRTAWFLGRDGGIWSWDGERPPVRWANHPGAIAIAAGSKQVVVGTRDRLWGGNPPDTWHVSVGRLTDIAVSDDDRWAAASSADGSIVVLDVRDGSVVARTVEHQDRVAGVTFGASQLVSVSWDRTVRRWDLGALSLTPAEAVAQAERAWGMTLEEALRGHSSETPRIR